MRPWATYPIPRPRTAAYAAGPPRKEVNTVEDDAAPVNVQSGRQQPEGGKGSDRFAAAGFAHDSDDFAVVHREGRVVDERHTVIKGDTQVVYLQEVVVRVKVELIGSRGHGLGCATATCCR
ncbi:hypothetical protein AAHB34_12320 [Paenarthrobacter ureafaciens]